jgi:hypothetical protein
VNGADALAEARRAYAAQQARQAEVDKVAEQLAVQLAWFRANPDWLSRALAAKATTIR